MEKKEKELEQLVKDLESELAAAMRREELLLNPVGGGGGKLKQRIKGTKIGRLAANPSSKIGKIVRSPRTMYRLITNPGIIKEMRAEKKKGQELNSETDGGENKSLFVPIKFFRNDDVAKRINVVSDGFDVELIKIATEIANKGNMELRIVTYGESANPMKYNKAVKKKEISKTKKVSFYSSVDQDMKNRVFELEVGDDDIFVTRAWKNDKGE